MTSRNAQLTDLYRHYRLAEQQRFYRGRARQFQKARNQSRLTAAFLLFGASMAGALGGADVADARRWWAVAAGVLSALATALTSYEAVYGFDRLSRDYERTIGSLARVEARFPSEAGSPGVAGRDGRAHPGDRGRAHRRGRHLVEADRAGHDPARRTGAGSIARRRQLAPGRNPPGHKERGSVTPRTVRRLVLAVFIGGIAGMILGSILDSNGVAVTFGLITATAALGLILVTAVAGPTGFSDGGPDRRGAPALDDDRAGALVEEQVEALTAAGADEQEVRELVRRSIAFRATVGVGVGRGSFDPQVPPSGREHHEAETYIWIGPLNKKWSNRWMVFMSEHSTARART